MSEDTNNVKINNAETGGFSPAETEKSARETVKTETYSEVGKLSPARNGFGMFWVLLCVFYALVMLSTGFNFFPLVAIALAAASALFVFVDTLRSRPVRTFYWAAFVVLFCSTFLYFLIWSAEPFGKRLWWNLVLVMAPMALSVVLLFLKKPSRAKPSNS